MDYLRFEDLRHAVDNTITPNHLSNWNFWFDWSMIVKDGLIENIRNVASDIMRFSYIKKRKENEKRKKVSILGFVQRCISMFDE